ncbi:unnamed protein product [Prorocentrum cordatum]|uniref:Uncharacterized protein n=1 Tax=Prorocentrum cordatum TaxID=2364126 RepID=A0ABN9T9N1_9DINO|nr:unnamed protein product [Polarella glacialis]
MTAAAAPGGSTGGDDASLAKEEGPPRKRGRIAQSAEDDAGGSGARAPLEFALEPDEYAIALDMTGKAGLGLDVDWADGKTLLIKALKKEDPLFCVGNFSGLEGEQEGETGREGNRAGWGWLSRDSGSSPPGRHESRRRRETRGLGGSWSTTSSWTWTRSPGSALMWTGPTARRYSSRR